MRRRGLFRHEPEGYQCPFCAFVHGEDNGVNAPGDLVYQDELVTAFIAPYWWPRNAGHVIIVPNAHYENLYTLPQRYGHRIYDIAQAIALALKRTYSCQGVSTRQHNEPAGYQEIWRLHLHVFPRYEGDDLYGSPRSPESAPVAERRAYAELLARYLAEADIPAISE